MQNACTNTVVTLIGLEAQTQISLYRIHAVFLQLVCLHFVHQADTSALLIKVDNHATSFLLNHLHCLMKLRAAIATVRAEDVASST